MNEKEFSIILSSGESLHTEFKSWKKAGNMKERIKLAVDELVAFANANGGVLVVGIEDNREITGFDCMNAHKVNEFLEAPYLVDGNVKINYNVSKGETINYNVKTTITDLNENVGADDVWYINSWKIYVTIPNGLTYVPDKKLGEPTVTSDNNNTYLTYVLPYTKPNMEIPGINFKTTLSPTLVGTGIPLTVTSTVEAINVNGE